MATADLTLSIDRIKGDPNNIRTKVEVKPIEGLAESIAESGLLQPIIVRPVDDHYIVIAGHRRLAAIGQLVDAKRHDGNIPVIIRNGETTDADVTVWQLVENLQREDIAVLDEAAGYMRLLEFDMTQADIARKVGRSRAHITKRLALLSLPDKARTALGKGTITIEHALAIAALPSEDAAEFCEGNLNDEHRLRQIGRQQKGRKAAEKLAKDLEATGLRIVETIEEQETPEDQHYETQEVIWASDWDGSVPTDAEVAVVQANGEEASGRIYKLVPNTNGKTADKESKRVEAEKARKKEERAVERAKTDFLTRSLDKVKAADAQEMALTFVIDRGMGYSNASQITGLLDLDVPVKEEQTYDGKTKQVKQHYPLLLSLVKQAREDGDIGFLRRVVMAVAATYGYRDRLLELYGYDPEAEAEAAAAAADA